VVGALATAGGVVFYGTLEGLSEGSRCKTGQGTLQVQDPVRIIGNVTTYENGGRPVCGRVVRRRRLGRYRLAAGLTDPTAGLARSVAMPR